MSITRKDVDEIMRLLDQSTFNELKLETGDLKLHIRRQGAPAPAADAMPVPAPAAPAQAATKPAHPAPEPCEIDVPSPLLGVFYRAPKPGEPCFVEVGQAVEADTIIGIVEVMKLMNTVRAGICGEIVAIFAPNAEMVEYDQPLLRIRKAA